MKLSAYGMDVAKTVFQVHGAWMPAQAAQTQRGADVFREARAVPDRDGSVWGARYWARKLSKMGHTVKLIAPQFVKPYVKTNENEVADAEAICEAVTGPNMRFVAIKTEQ